MSIEKTQLRKAFEEWAIANGHCKTEHYYFQGSQERRLFDETQWEAWQNSAYLILAFIKNTVECEHCSKFQHLAVCPICKGEKKVLNPLKDYALEIQNLVSEDSEEKNYLGFRR